MEKIISKEEINELIGIKGEVRGMALKNHQDFILEKRGSKGLKELEKTMAEIGYPIKHKEIKHWEFYPIYLEIIELLVIKKLFNFEDEKFEEIGVYGSRVSFIMKMYLKYFGSIEMLADRASKIWKKYYTVGDLKVKDLDKKKKYIILIVENLYLHPIHCLHLKGYFLNTVEMVVGKKAICEEIQCAYRGDKRHEFLIKW